MAKSLSINFGSSGGSSTNPPNLLIAATDGSGNIIDGTANVIQRPLTGYVVGTNTVLSASDTVLTAFQKLQGQVTARINNQTTVQTGSSFNIDTRAIVTQANLAATTVAFGSNQVSPFTVAGGSGQSTSFSGTSAGAGNAGAINITGGTGGTSLATGTTSGAGGDIEIAGGASGIANAGAAAGRAGFVSMKGGNSISTNGSGGNLYLVSGQGSGTGIHGGIFLGLSPSDVIRGTTFIGCNQGEISVAASTDRLYVKGRAKFIDTPVIGVAAVNNNEFVIKGQFAGGTFTFTGDGTTDSFSIPTAWTTNPITHIVTRNSDPEGNLFQTQATTPGQIDVQFVSGAPLAGNVVVVNWFAFI